tara:strand:+ start:175 stop:525 length:351 start_codon:yes stop_codon:yes gene_type:complete
METSKIIILVVLNVIFMLGWTIALAQKQIKGGKKLIKKGWMKILVRERKLTPKERLAARIGYLGAGLLIAAQWTVSPPLYIVGFICVLIQTAVRKQWNLVILQLNGLIAWMIHLLS